MKRPAAPLALASPDVASPDVEAALREYVIEFCEEQGLSRAAAIAELEGLPHFSMRAAAVYVHRARLSTWELEQLIATRRRMRFVTRGLPLLSLFAVAWYFVGPVIPPSIVIVGSLVGLILAARLAWKVWNA